MKETIEKLKSVIRALEKEHGPFLIFALFLREAALERWDIVISATWLNSTEMGAYKIISSKLQEFLSDSELVQLSRIVLLDQDDPVDIELYPNDLENWFLSCAKARQFQRF
jgi:hypothetical protein